MNAAAEIYRRQREAATAEIARRSQWDSITRLKKAIEDAPSWKEKIMTVYRHLSEMGVPRCELTANEFEPGCLTLKVHLTIADEDWVFFLITPEHCGKPGKAEGEVEQQVGRDPQGRWTAVASDRSGCVSRWVFEPSLNHWIQSADAGQSWKMARESSKAVMGWLVSC